MKKIYITPEVEVSKFSLAADILSNSNVETPGMEGTLYDFTAQNDDFGAGWGWGT